MTNIHKYNEDEINNKGMKIEFDSKYAFGMPTIDNLFSFILDLIIQTEDYNNKYKFKTLAHE